MSAPFNKEQELDDVYANLAHEIKRADRAEARVKELEVEAERMSTALNGEMRAYLESDCRNELRKAHARIYELEKPRNCSDGSCMKCHGCYEVMRAEFNDAADDRDELVSAIAYGMKDIWAGKDWTPVKRFEKALKKTIRVVPGTGQFHKRPDGSECSYMAETFCNKCGWVDPKLMKEEK